MREISSTALYNRFTHNGCTWGASVHHPDPVARLPEMQYNPLSTRQATRKKEREKREPRDLDRRGEAGAKAALLCVTGWRPVALRKSRCAGGGGAAKEKQNIFQQPPEAVLHHSLFSLSSARDVSGSKLTGYSSHTRKYPPCHTANKPNLSAGAANGSLHR